MTIDIQRTTDLKWLKSLQDKGRKGVPRDDRQNLCPVCIRACFCLSSTFTPRGLRTK